MPQSSIRKRSVLLHPMSKGDEKEGKGHIKERKREEKEKDEMPKRDIK